MKILNLLVCLLILISFNSHANQPLVYGHSFKHHSKAFNQPRRYMVSLPERYQAESFSYPTLYVIDGDFQFHHVSNTVKHLARMGKIPQMIVVGIANQGPKDYLLSNTWKVEGESEFGEVKLFNRYLSNELIPLIDKSFRTTTKKAIAGYSLGGLYVMQSYIDTESPFNAFIAMSPSVWYDDYAYKSKLSHYLKATKTTKNDRHRNAPLFVSLANEAGMGVEDVVSVLRNTTELQKDSWQYKHYPEETHYSAALPALYDALVFVAPKHFVDIKELAELSSVEAIFDAFESRKSSWTGFRLDWLQSYTLAKYMSRSKKNDKIDYAIARTEELFPESKFELVINFSLGLNKKKKHDSALKLLKTIEKANSKNAKWLNQMGLAYAGIGETELARQYHQKSLKAAKESRLESWEYWELQP